MKYIKLYEEFTYEQDLLEPEVELQPEVSDKTIDDVLEPEFLEEPEEEVTQDKRGVYNISGWYIY